MPELFDVIIIGSGPAGVHAALPLAEAGKRIAIMDGGLTPPSFLATLPDRNYEDVRRNDTEQHRIFLGEDYSGIPMTGPQAGALLGGNRAYVVKDADTRLPIGVKNGQISQSLACGGLGAAWGAECAFLNHNELISMGLSPSQLRPHEDAVTKHIGLSGPSNRAYVQSPLRPDHHTERLLQKALSKKDLLTRNNMHVERTHIAALTQPLGDRKPISYTDMEYYTDAARSVYRPQFTLEELRKLPNVRHLPGFIAQSIRQTEGTHIVAATMTDASGGMMEFTAAKIILAAGTIGSARIVLQSLNRFDTPVPFLGKDHSFVVCANTSMIGKAGPKERTSLCQIAVHDTAKNSTGLEASYTQLYSYRAFQLLRLVGSMPLPLPEAMHFLTMFTPTLMIADVRFPVVPDARNTLILRRTEDGKSRVEISLERSPEELRERAVGMKRLRRTLRTLGLVPLRTMHFPLASSAHYAGTIPMSAVPDEFPLSTTPDGEVRGLPGVYVADGSVFRALPAKPFTFTIMANARRIAMNVLNTLQRNA